MIKLGNRFQLIVMMDGKEIPLEHMGFDALQMHSNVMFYQPVGRIVIADRIKWFDANPIGDGAKVDIFVGTNEVVTEANLYRFRLFRYSVTKVNNVNYYTLFLAFNCPRYFNENVTGAITGSSYDALQGIAKTIGVKFKGDPTSDSQIWIGQGKKRCVFARDIALHGWSGTTSCMSLGMTLLGEMRYVDISAIKARDTENYFVMGAGDNESVFRVLGRKELSKAGLVNNMVGYKMETVEQSPDGNTNHNSVTVTMNSAPTLSVNKTLNDQLEGSRVAFTPISAGNTHPNFYKAKHNNRRLRAMYSYGSHIATDGLTGLDLFDPVKFLFYDNTTSDTLLNQAVSGTYIITAKTIFATKEGRYFEKLEIVRQGVNYYSGLVPAITTHNSAR